jgi:hypothetical protein
MTYCWQTDAKSSYETALYFIALRLGSRRFKTLPDMYWLEGQGLIP